MDEMATISCHLSQISRRDVGFGHSRLSTRLNGREVLANVRHYARNGSIITFHDSIKSYEKLQYALPRAIEWLLKQGYEFKVFP